MKSSRHSFLLALAITVAAVPSALAALSFTGNYGGSTYHTHSGASVISFDWGTDGSLYYATSDSSYFSGGVFKFDGSTPSQIFPGGSGSFAGASVVSLGSSIYFNDSDLANNQFIREYGTTSGSVNSITVSNYSLASYGGSLWMASGDFASGASKIHWFENGIVGGSIDLGSVDGATGPLTFDSAGNLYYAVGSGSLQIYKWSAAEVAAAINGFGTPALDVTDHIWVDYTADFAGFAGATSMVVDANGNLVVTLTNWSDPSALVRFNADGSGNYGGSHETIATSAGRLGEVRLHGGELYIADDNNIVRVIPEPSALLLSIVAGAGLVIRRRRRD